MKIFLFFSFFFVFLFANPKKPVVTHGSVSVEKTESHQLLIHASDRAIIHWNEFSIDEGEVTQFLTEGWVLNRVTGENPSQIFGQLLSNGNLVLINPNGIILSPDGLIDVKKFIVSTFDVLDEDFLKKNPLNFYKNSSSPICLKGLITGENLIIKGFDLDISGSLRVVKSGGRVYLSGEDKIYLTGHVSAPSGRVEVLGREIVMPKESLIDVSDPFDGGKISIGVGAETVDVSAHLLANSTLEGNGGNIFIWSDKDAQFHGKIEACAVKGRGGNAEVSAVESITVSGFADLRSKEGVPGTYLLDPGSVTINSSLFSSGPNTFGTTFINAQLLLGNLTISTANATNGNPEDIIVQSGVSIIWTTSTQLALLAGRSVIWNNASLTCTGLKSILGDNDIALVLEGSGNSLHSNAGVEIIGGSLVISTLDRDIQITGTGYGLSSTNAGVYLSEVDISSTNGDITITGNVTGDNDGAPGVLAANGASVSSLGLGNMVIHGTGNGTGSDSHGIELISSSGVHSIGTGNIQLTGIASVNGGLNSSGIRISGSTTQVDSDNGDINFTGTGGASEKGILISDNADALSVVSAPIEFLSTGDIILSEGGSVIGSISPMTFNTSRDLIILGGSSSNFISGIFPGTAGSVTISVGRDLILSSGSGANAHAQIGSRGLISTSSIILPFIGRDVFIQGSNSESYALVGHGNESNLSTSYSGDIFFSSVVGNLTVSGANTGAGGNGWGQIGHVDFSLVDLSGDILIDVGDTISVLGGASSSQAWARIGHGGFDQLTGLSSEMLLKSGVDIILTSSPLAGTAQVVNDSQSLLGGSGDLTLVVDDIFPNFPDYGPGEFNTNSDLRATGQLRIYSVQPNQNSINSLINGAPFVSGPFGVDTSTEQFSIYYPDGTYDCPRENPRF
ncbi:MAG: filamentous hemagglutinin N-terminal domain-containing protein [Simkaniaceae bacterium]